MSSAELENLVRTGQLQHEPVAIAEVRALVASGEARLADARNPSLALESRFDLAYNAAHALSLAALRPVPRASLRSHRGAGSGGRSLRVRDTQRSVGSSVKARLRAAAAADVEAACLWYEGQRPGLGDESCVIILPWKSSDGRAARESYDCWRNCVRCWRPST